MNITFDGKLLNNYFLITNLQGLGLPQTRDNELQLMNANGSIFESSNFESRVITLSAEMLSDANKTIYQKLDEVKGILAPYKGEKQLELSVYPDRYIMARYSGTMDVEQFAMKQSFPVTFKCSDPLWYEQVEQSLTIAGSATAKNNGNFPTKQQIYTLTVGSGVTSVISNTTTGKNLTIKNTSISSQTLEINFKTNSITNIGGSTNFMNFYVSGEFFTLNPGDNIITISNATNSSVKFRSTWV